MKPKFDAAGFKALTGQAKPGSNLPIKKKSSKPNPFAKGKFQGLANAAKKGANYGNGY